MEDELLQKLLNQNTEDLKKFLNGIKWESRRPYGGQHAGIDPGVVLTHEDYGIRIEVFEKRSQIENRRIAIVLFYHFLDRLNYLKKEADGEDTTTALSQDVPGGPES